jgi:pimeloyl-ACP methyl ester carboxylesterase
VNASPEPVPSTSQRPVVVVAARALTAAIAPVLRAGGRCVGFLAHEELPTGDRAALAAIAVELTRLERADLLGIGPGSPLALLLACTSSAVSGCALIGGPLVYPRLDAARPTQPLELALNLACPLHVFHGSHDPDLPPAHVALARAKLAQFARDAGFHAIAGGAAGWCDPASSGYRALLVHSAVERAIAELATADD